MPRWTTLLLLLLAVAMGSLSFGSAASLRVSANDLSSGVYESSIVLLECDLGDAAVSLVRADVADASSAVVGATITGVDDRCRGENLVVTAFDANGGELSRAFGVAPLGDGPSALLAFNDATPAESITTLDLALVG